MATTERDFVLPKHGLFVFSGEWKWYSDRGDPMRWFHTIVLPLVTIIIVYMGHRKRTPSWKDGALILGCGLMLSGLWLTVEYSTILLIGGGAVFSFGIPRGLGGQKSRPEVECPSAGAAKEPGTGAIHVSFPRPRYLVGDARVVLLLDGASFYEGGFKAGIDVTTAAAPGSHRLESVIDLGIAKRRRSWEVAVSASGCDVILSYSRFWGNFAKSVRSSSPTAGSRRC
jgi:hypothetical protein